MSTELAVQGSQQLAERPQKAQIAMNETGVDFRSFDEMARFCSAVHDSGLAPKSFGSPQAIMVAVQMGLEIGLKPMQALQSIAVINGRPSVWGDGALALCRAHKDFEDIEETTEGEAETKVARCTVKRKGQTPVVREFSYKDAKLAGLIGKAGPWTQYPLRMLSMRARSWALRDAFADALRGVSVAEEAQDYETKPAKVVREITTKFEDAE